MQKGEVHGSRLIQFVSDSFVNFKAKEESLQLGTNLYPISSKVR